MTALDVVRKQACAEHNWTGLNGHCPDCNRVGLLGSVVSFYEVSCPLCGAQPHVACEGIGCHDERYLLARGGQLTPAPREVAEAFATYLNSHVCMLLFSKLTLYRAMGENPRVVVSWAGKRYRVSVCRSNGEVEHFNRDGKS